MPPILTRKIVAEIVFLTMLSLVGLTGVFMLLGVAMEGARAGIDPVSLLRLMPYLAAPALPYTIPVCLLLACTLVFGRMSGSNEIVALKASGVNVMRLLWPVLALSVLASGVCLLFADRVVPTCRQRIRDAILGDVETTLYSYIRQNHGIQNSNLPYELYADAVDGTRLVRPIIKRRKKAGGYDLVVQAREATLQVVMNPQSLESELVVRLVDGVLTTGAENSAYFQDRTERMPIPDSFKNGEGYFTSEHTLDGLRRQEETLARDAANLRVELAAKSALSALAGDLPTQERDRKVAGALIELREAFAYRSACEVHQRIARSFAAIPFVLLGFPLSILLRQREMLRTFFLCFLPIVTIYWPSVLLATNLLRESQSHQWGLLWLPTIGMCLAATPLVRRMVRH